jgi:hypothetical protein
VRNARPLLNIAGRDHAVSDAAVRAFRDNGQKSVARGQPGALSGRKFAKESIIATAREGSDKDGRQYIIAVSATDNANNLGSASMVVTVPHDQ